MTLPDATAGAQLASGYFEAAWLCFLDFDGDPVRVTTARASLALSGTGDADLDGHTFSAVSPAVVAVGDVANGEGGSETLSLSLSGIVGPDADVLAAIGDASAWRGRSARLWAIIRDASGAQQGAIWPVYTGRMSAAQIMGGPDGQTVKLDVESYLAQAKNASFRTYLDQAQFDPADNTAALKIGVANGATKGVAGAAALPAGYEIPGYGFFAIPQVPF